MGTIFTAIILTIFFCIAIVGVIAAIIAYIVFGLFAGLCIMVVTLGVLLIVATFANLPRKPRVITERTDHAHGDVPHVSYPRPRTARVRDVDPVGA